MRVPLLILALLLAGLPGAVAGADAPAATAPDSLRRPTVGIAFGGGAARGAAHVGVIRVLEELRVPVDYVAGTSMGSIVGALYSLGLTADQIEAELRAVDWADIFSDRMPRRQRSMRRKADDTRAFLPLEWGLKHGHLQPPRGLIAGQKFAYAFPNPALLTAGHAGFDDLPIPYRAVATDLETGEKVVLDRGDLLSAVRASMSIPGVFPPVERDGRLLVDGFLASNVPVDVVRAMGADIVIAIDVGRREQDLTPEELETMGGITEAAARIVGQRAVAVELARADIVLRPDVSAWTGQEYDRIAEIIPLGEAAARERADTLAVLGVAPAAYAAWRRHVAATPLPPDRVDLLVLDNRSRVDDRAIAPWLDVPLGRPLDLERLRRSLADIYELGMFERVDFDVHREDAYEVLTVRPREKPYAPVFVRLGLSYVSSYEGASRFQGQARVTVRELNRLGGEWRTDLGVGRETALRSGFYQPLDWRRRWYARADVEAGRRRDGFFLVDPNRVLAQYELARVGAEVAVGRTFGRWLDLRAGVEVARLTYDFTVGLIGLPRSAAEQAGPRARLRVDTLDDHTLPHSGVLLGADYVRPSGWLGTPLRYERLWGHALAAAGNERNVVLLDAQGGSDLGTEMPFHQQFTLGGLRTLSGFNTEFLRGDAFGLASLGWLHRLGGGDLPFSTRAHLGLWAEAGGVWYPSRTASLDLLEYCGAVTLLLDTAAGPLHLGYGRSASGHDAFHVEFGIHLATPRNAP